jgi:hypothetical protein
MTAVVNADEEYSPETKFTTEVPGFGMEPPGHMVINPELEPSLLTKMDPCTAFSSRSKSGYRMGYGG